MPVTTVLRGSMKTDRHFWLKVFGMHITWFLKQSGDSSIYDVQLHIQMDALLNGDSLYTLNKETLINTELRMTKHFLDYVQYAYGNKVDPKAVQ